MTENLTVHIWTTLVCKFCKAGFQVESINAIGKLKKNDLYCPFCLSTDVVPHEIQPPPHKWVVPDKVEWLTVIQFPSGEECILNKNLDPRDLNNISNMWDTIRTEEIRRIELGSKQKILTYLQGKGYKILRQEKVTFR